MSSDFDDSEFPPQPEIQPDNVPAPNVPAHFVAPDSETLNSKSTDSETLVDQSQRLQRVMAAAGIGSRRECELLILEGRVEVDGQIVATLGVKVDPDIQKIFVDGDPIRLQRLEYYMLNKPPGVVSTASDPGGRARVIDLIKTQQRVYNVGRLDQSSEGLILVTNDGELANRLTHPRYGIDKRYSVLVDGVPTREQLRALEEGIYIAEGKAKASQAKIVKRSEKNCWLEIVLSEGRNREIRRLLAKIGHRVRVLRRIAIGPLKLADLPLGAHRRLRNDELKLLRQVTGMASDAKATKSTKEAKSTKATKSTKETKGTRSRTTTSQGGSSRGFAGNKTSFKHKNTGVRKNSASNRGSDKPTVSDQPSRGLKKQSTSTWSKPAGGKTRPAFKGESDKKAGKRTGKQSDSRADSRTDSRSDWKKNSKTKGVKTRGSTPDNSREGKPGGTRSPRKPTAKKKPQDDFQSTIRKKRRVNPKGRSR